MVEFDGVRAGLAEEADRAREICRREGARDVQRALDDAERTRFWHARRKAFGAMGRLAPDVLVQDATVPRSKLPRVLEQIVAIGKRDGLRVVNYFHAGDGNLHPNILYDRRDPEQLARVEKASKEIMELATGHMRLPTRIEVAPAGTTADKVSQEFFIVEKAQKPIPLIEAVANGFGGR